MQVIYTSFDFFQGYRSTLSVNRAGLHCGWARAVVVTGAERYKVNVPDGKTL